MTKTPEQLEYDKFLALSLLAETDGGKIIVGAALADITASIERLVSDYKTASHTDLIVLCAQMQSRLGLYRSLTRAEKNLKTVDVIIKEALTDTNE